MNLADQKDKLITITLAKTNGSRVRAAKLLGISTRGLFHMLERRKARGMAVLHKNRK